MDAVNTPDAAGGPAGETLVVHDVPALTNLGVIARKALALDGEALVRVRSLAPGSPDDLVGATRPAMARVWATTPFGPLACRTMAATPSRDDVVVRADAVATATGDARSVPQVDAAIPATLDCGPAADASWPGSLPTEGGWTVVDSVPAAVFRRLEAEARAVAKEESGPMGLPASLLDQTVVTVRGGGRDVAAEVTMREVFALCAMGFVPAEPGDDETVRVSAKGRWRRLDGRYGSVYAKSGLGVLPV